MTPRRSLATFSVWVRTTMPSAHGVVQEAGVPLAPSISTTHSRHDPKVSSESVAHSLGTSTPAVLAARITEVPGGTATSMPSMVNDTVAAPSRAGVPKSGSFNSTVSLQSPSARPLRGTLSRKPSEVLPEVLHRRAHRHGGQPTHRAQRPVGHQLAQVLEQDQVLRPVLPGPDAVDRLHPAHRADPARGALAAGLLGAELHREARHLRHVHRV